MKILPVFIIFVFISINIAEYSYSYSTTLIADFDTSMAGKELISWHNKKIYIWKSDKTLLNGWPIELDGIIEPSPVIGAHQDKGKILIVATIGEDKNCKIYSFSSDGRLINGWPKNMDFIPSSMSANGNILMLKDSGENTHAYDIEKWEEVNPASTEGSITIEADNLTYSSNGPAIQAYTMNEASTFEYGYFHHLKQPFVRGFNALLDPLEGKVKTTINIESNSVYDYDLTIYNSSQEMIVSYKGFDGVPDQPITCSWNTNSTNEPYTAILELGSTFGEKAVSILPLTIETPSAELIASVEADESQITLETESDLPVSSIYAEPPIFCPRSLNDHTQFHYTIGMDDENIRKKISVSSNTGQTIKILEDNEPCFRGSFTDIWFGDTTSIIADKDNDGYADEGEYIFTVELSDVSGQLTAKSTQVKIISPPKLSLSTNLEIFSPNNDGVKDNLTICYGIELSRLSDNYALTELAIYDENDKLTFKKEERLQVGLHSYIWDGRSNITYKTVPDGKYRINLTVEDEFGNTATVSKENIIVDTTTPKISDVNFSNDPFRDCTTINFTLDEPGATAIYASGRMIAQLQGKAGINSFNWTETGGFEEGSHRVEITATDEAGNTGMLLGEKFVVIDRTPPNISIETASPIVFNPYVLPAELKYTLHDNYSKSLASSIIIYSDNKPIKLLKDNELLNCGLPLTDTWNGQNNGNLYLNEGTYEAIIFATDEAGNSSAASREIMIRDDQRLTTSPADSKIPYINNWIEGSGNYKLIAQAKSTSNNLATFYLPERQTIKVVTYNVSGSTKFKRCGLFDNFRNKIIFDHNISGIYYYDLPEGSYTALADFTRSALDARTDIYAVDENEVKNYYSDIINVKYYEREYTVNVKIDSSAFAGFMSEDNDEDLFLINDASVYARFRTVADDYISSEHELLKYGKHCSANTIFRSTRRGRNLYKTLTKGIYLTFVRASAQWLAGWARTIVYFDDKKFDEYIVSSNNSGRNWTSSTGPAQSDYDYYFDNYLGYWGKTNCVIHKVEAINGQLYYLKGVIVKEGSHTAPQFNNNEYVAPSSITSPEVLWKDRAQITFNAINPKNPSLCEDSSGNIYTVWEDSRNGSSEVYFQKIPYDFEPISSGISGIMGVSRTQTSVLNENITNEPFSVFETVKFEISNVLNHPNPFNPNRERTKIRYQLTQNADSVEINIYSMNGNLVETLKGKTNGSNISLYNDVLWDGRNRYGDVVANGAYIFEVIAEKNGETVTGKGKIVVLK